MRSAVFTIVRNEDVFLPIWLRHYSKHFYRNDIFVIDNGTTDGSTHVEGATFVPRISTTSFDAPWMLHTVRDFQRELLKSYDWVLFAEVDEIIHCPIKLCEYPNNKFTTLSCMGYEVIQDLNEEPPLDLNRPLLKQRRYWAPSDLFSKPLYSRVPLDWRLGFHSCTQPHTKATDLTLIHLHRMDFNIAAYRNEHRKNISVDPESVAKRQGHQNFVDRKALANNWNGLIKSGARTPIPEKYRDVL